MRAQATARGVPSLPTWMALDTDMPAINERLRVGTDPFTGDPVMNVRGLALDVALLHVPAVDAEGNVYVDGDLALDGRSPGRRSDDRLLRAGGRRRSQPGGALTAVVDAVVPAPEGAWPTGCHARYGAGLDV